MSLGEGFFQNSWAIWVVIAGVLLVFGEIFLRRKIHWVFVIRILWILMLGWTIAEWTKVLSKQLSQPEALHILIDRSSSVFDLPERKKNLDLFLEELKEWTSSRKQPTRIFSFGANVQAETFDLKGNGSLKTLLEPVNQVLKDQDGSVILISDGLWSDYARLPLPTYAVQIADQEEKDVWIDSVQPVFTAFLKNRLKIPVTIAQKGFSGKTVKLSLWLSGQKIQEVEKTLTNPQVTFDFNYFPEKMGENIFILKVSSLAGELSELNNETSFRVRTVRDKMRILHISGRPSTDMKAWRLFLTKQPDVDLVSFYILRSINDIPEAKNDELSLIPFPYEELFSTELEKFDVVILQNFDFNLYFQPFYLANLAQFVRQGGSLLMIGGDQGFHRYRSSPLEPLLPFEFNGIGKFEQDPLSARVVNQHPVIDGLDFAFQIPQWRGYHRLHPRADSTDLVRYSNGIPFVSLRQIDKGRIVTINSDESWKLQFQPMNSAPVFNKLARKIVQYLTFDPEMDPERLISSKWQVGKSTHLHLASDQAVDWKISPLLKAGSKMGVSFKNEREIDFEVTEPGVYEVKVSNLPDAFVFETEEKPWREEWKNLIHDNLKMKKIAENSSGKFFEFDDRKKIFNQPLSGTQIVSASTESWTAASTASSWAILLLTLFFMCLDFFIRKKLQWDG
ncbi:MAG: hypothetical protein J0L93_03915 [Deltaproteobacteria bacterium]|nr:hypothetical protein [Deltaproteobacteria bacterium]